MGRSISKPEIQVKDVNNIEYTEEGKNKKRPRNKRLERFMKLERDGKYFAVAGDVIRGIGNEKGAASAIVDDIKDLDLEPELELVLVLVLVLVPDKSLEQ